MILADGSFLHPNASGIFADNVFSLFQNATTAAPPRMNCTTEAFYNSSDAHSVNFCSLRQFSKEQITTLDLTCTVCGALSFCGAAFIIATFAVFKDLRVPSLQLIMCVLAGNRIGPCPVTHAAIVIVTWATRIALFMSVVYATRFRCD